ncbi:MAG: YifB family Mg chelatase-like AAA ATPase [Paludibacteraceae bacterium]|nr:YifB family Mg chelatase-like AAA ATPase [Paludibacteraceae bacterium]
MLIKIYSAALAGIDAVPVTIEVHSTPGFDFTLVGLPDSAVKESHERILAALTVNSFETLHRSFTINMAPADIKKEGTAFDLPLAIGMLAGAEKLKSKELEHYMIMGELSLDGSLQPIRGALPIALCARKEGFRGLILPAANAEEAAVVDGLQVYGLNNLIEVIHFLNGEPKDELQPDNTFEPVHVDMQTLFDKMAFPTDVDFSDVRGQFKLRRAVEIAAAGGHNMIMVGPPGAGKSMIAKRIPTILPPLTLDEALETTKIHSIAGLTNKRKGASSTLIVQRPFRSPHHTITDTALVGGGTNPHPGEISLAHNGVLFLDELPEYKRSVLEVMRQPLEDRHITVARTKETVDYPASFILVAAMNPCPCGHYGENNPAHPCTCTPAQVHRYLSKISGPLLDRIDIQCEIEAVPYEQLRDTQPGESSAAIRERVMKARAVQNERFKHSKLIHCNAMMNSRMVRQYCALDAECDKLLEFTMAKLGLSARAYDRILKVARTIADIEGAESIRKNHLLEAISYRSLDRNNWGG